MAYFTLKVREKFSAWPRALGMMWPLPSSEPPLMPPSYIFEHELLWLHSILQG